ncbi:alpha-glucosidase C-terminal domain-containing protein [bacterium]|nr:alpha-glucosidase C-terminal domain-containing protein [bacterium]MBU1072508.1 alpha-glucosidase C-terminal domain-containing protein [bacterium]MBU1676543.1 alpha-glucosidase C-terminal domain-containing protein [bacterium]
MTHARPDAVALGPRLRTTACVAVLTALLAAAPALAPAQGQDPSDEIFYHFMPICWRDSDGDTFRFGDFGGMTSSLPYLQTLGVTAVWMNPVFPSVAYHGYQHGAGDQLNPWFGDEGDFVGFIEAAHAAGIKVFVDFVAYGISRDEVWFQDAYGNPGSVYDDWLAFTNSANTEYQGSTFTTWNGDTVRQIWWDLRDSHPVDLVTQWARHWLDPDGDGDFADGLDGFRLDHVWQTYPNGPDGWGYHIDTFWAPWRAALRDVNPDVFVFAEQADWGISGVELLGGMDAAFTKPFEFAARDALQNEYASALYGAMASAVAVQGAAPVGTFLCTINDHDITRLATQIGDGFEKGKAAAAILLTQPFAPVIYHGDEIGMRGAKNTGYTGDAADIPMREPFKWNAVAGPPMSNYFALNAAAYAGRISQDNDGRSVEEQLGVPGSLLEAYRELIAARRDHVALRRGGYAPVTASSGAVWAFVRDHADQQVLVAINVDGSAKNMALDLGDFTIAGGATTPLDLLTGATLSPLTGANKDAYPLALAPYGYRLLEVEVTAPEPPPSLVDGRGIPADFGAAGLLATQDGPTHLGDNVSELDQLYVRARGDSLFLGLTGNLAPDGTGLCLLLDFAPGGQNVLDLSDVSPPPNGPDMLTGLRLDAGFAPDQLLFVNTFSGNIYVDLYALLDGGGTDKTYRGAGTVGAGHGVLSGGVNPNGLRVAQDNSNTGGVTASDVSDAASATTGCEIYMSLADLGLAGGDIDGVKLAAFLLESGGDVSNQWLPGLGGLTGSLGVAPDMTEIAGDQFVVLDSATAVGGPAGGDGTWDLSVSTGGGSARVVVINLRLPSARLVGLAVYNVRGERVRELFSGRELPAGDHVFGWDGRDDRGHGVPAGVYLCRLQSGADQQARSVVLVK